MNLIDLTALGLPSTIDVQSAPPEASAAPHRQPVDGPRTRDRLVELHVLTEHGDAAAAAEAGEWLDDDPDARRVWNQVEARCHQLRADTANHAPPRFGDSPSAEDDQRNVVPPRA